MNVISFLVVLAEVISQIILTEALREPRFDAKSERKRWSHEISEIEQTCSVGQCVEAWKCPKNAISENSEGSCWHLNNGPWVCCKLENIHEFGNANMHVPHHSITNAEPKQTSTFFKRTASESNTNIESNEVTTPCLDDYVYGNTGKRRTAVGPLFGILKNVREDYPGARPWSKTTKFPYQDIPKKTDAHNTRDSYFTTKSWMKTTKYPHFVSKKTTYTPYKSTSIINNFRTTNSFYKPKTSESRIIFPTESVPVKFTHHSSNTAKSSKRTFQSPSTTKSWSRSTPTASTKTLRGKSTLNNVRTVFKTTHSPFFGKSTRSTKATTHRANPGQVWGKPTTPQYSRNQTKRFAITNRATPKTTTEKYKVTTPLPNVNIYICGIRDQEEVFHRRRRSYNRSLVSDVTNHKSRVPFQRIVGGEEAEPFSWPWVAALYKVTSSGGNRFLSAGSLINENFILTAAHVFTPDDLKSASFVAMLGTHDAQDAVAQYKVSSVLPHPKYEHRYYYYDIALLKLQRPVAFNDYIMPVCLPSPHAPFLRDRDLEGKQVTVMGWGDESFGGKSSRVLKEATFPIVSRVSCNTSYVRVASNRFPRGITEDMLCAGDPNGGKDACQGDSGGPLTVVENRRYTQVGIVSFGYQCGDKEFPGVYTKVAPYLSWIAENTSK